MKPRVLIVEDDAVFRRGLARMFSPEEFEVVQVEDGERAVEALTQDLPVLILCDLRLPGMDGLGVLNHLNRSGRSVPFILITAHYSEGLAREAQAQGAIAVWEKPIDLQQVRTQCEGILRRSRQSGSA
jgi:CheY-like chemotaxis protein